MKKIIALLLVIVLVLCCAACGVDDDHKFIKIDTYDYQGYMIHLVYEPETKVEYFIRGHLMCPRYDQNGNISFYRGE